MSELLLRAGDLGAGHARVGGLAVPPLRRALGLVRVGDRRGRDRDRPAFRPLPRGVGGRRWELGGRESVFDGMPWALYLPRDTRLPRRAPEGEVAICGARCETRRVPVLIRPEDVEVEVRGAGNATRQINHIVKPEFPAERLLVVEVFTPSGNWSSYPPHKHDEDQPPGEVVLEEIYYFRTATPEAFAVQRLYSPRHGLDVTETVRDGDLMLVPYGYHTTAAAHGYDLYYLNALAGDRRSMAAADDPDAGVDPRRLGPTWSPTRASRSSGDPRRERAGQLRRLRAHRRRAPERARARTRCSTRSPRPGYEGTELGPLGYLGDGNELRARLQRARARAGRRRSSRSGSATEDLLPSSRPTLDLLDGFGAKPVLADTGPRDGDVDLDDVERAVELRTRAAASSRRFHHHMRTRVADARRDRAAARRHRRRPAARHAAT